MTIDKSTSFTTTQHAKSSQELLSQAGPSSNESSPVHFDNFNSTNTIVDYSSGSDGNDATVEQPPKKKIKIERKDKVTLLESAFTSRIIKVANDIWESIDVDKKIDKSHVTGSYDEVTRNYSAKVKCLICSKLISLNTTKYSTSMSNYKRHVTTAHLQKDKHSKMKNQPTLKLLFDKKAEKASTSRSCSIDPGTVETVDLVYDCENGKE